jgi:hypothetical protein
MIKGPTDADHYRVKVGRYGERWYVDPLAASGEFSHDPETAYPSISTVKKASGQDWSFVSIKRIADADPDRLIEAAKLPPGDRYDVLTSINKRGLGRAAERGTNVHLYCEALLRNQTTLFPLTKGDPGYDYLPAVDEFFATYQPKLYAAEYPVFHRTLNGVGYGGTPDGIIDIGGELYAVDWKTRTETSDHGAYPEEGAQIAAGAFAEYMIAEDADGNAVRQPVPQLAGGLIISIKPDGCKLYPIDLATAWNHWEAMHAWWVARRTERLCVGKPWAPGKRTAALPKTTAKNNTATPPPRIAPDEGRTGVNVDSLRDKYKALDPAARSWVEAKRAEAQAAGVDFHLATPTERRAWIMSALCNLAAAEVDDDDTVKAIARHVTSDDACEWPTVTAGHAVGSLDVVQAKAFRDTALVFAAGMGVLEFDELGAKVAA